MSATSSVIVARTTASSHGVGVSGSWRAASYKGLIDRATAGITDPAERFVVGTRISGRLGWTHADIAGFLTGAGLDALDIPGGLAPRALRDIEAGQAAGRS